MDAKEEILSNLLKECVFDGWTNKTLEKSAEKSGLNKDYAHVAFPDGALGAALFYIAGIDDEMEKNYKKQKADKLKIREKIAMAVTTRLKLYAKNREAVRKIVAFMSLPQNAGAAVKSLSETVSKMWYLAGDNSTDYNYYTKRFLLGGVYSSTLLYWLNDKSENYADTEAFLMRRIEDVMQIQKLRGKAESFFEKLKNRAS